MKTPSVMATQAGCRRNNRGAALLTAMITVALVATIAASALWRQWRGVEIEAAERARVQSSWILTGALDWGRLILRGDLYEDRRKSQLTDHLGEPWSVPLAEARLSTFLSAGDASSASINRDAFLTGQIIDLQSRLNLMNLTAGDGGSAWLRFGRLFDLLHLPRRELDTLQRQLLQAHDAMQKPPGSGGSAPLLPTRFEQLAWLDVSDATLAALRPYATLLPLRQAGATPVNLNTATAEVIYAAIPELDLATAQRLVILRKQDPFRSAQQALAAVGHGDADPSWASVSSAFFEIRGRLRLDDVTLEEAAVVRRQGQSGSRGISVTPLWRQRSTLTQAPGELVPQQ